MKGPLAPLVLCTACFFSLIAVIGFIWLFTH